MPLRRCSARARFVRTSLRWNMTSVEHSGPRSGLSLLMGSVLVAAQLSWGAAFAEGSFFKGRPGTAAEAPPAPNPAPAATEPAPHSPHAKAREEAGSADP